MSTTRITRREVIRNTFTSATAGLAMMAMPDFTFAGQDTNEALVPFENEPPTKPDSLNWAGLTEWLTPQDQVFSVQHYGIPEVDAATYELEISGLVDHPRKFSIEILKSLPRQEQFMTLECSGNGSAPGFMNAVYNSRWTGTRLLPILKECGIKPGRRRSCFSVMTGTPRPFAREHRAS